YSGQFTRPAGTAANNIYNLADFMLGLRSQYALSNVLVAEMQRNMHFTYLQDDYRPADRQSGAALRIRDADVGSRQHAVELRPGGAPHAPRQRRIADGSGPGES